MLFALAAYGFWGFAPVYFKFLEFAAPVEIIAHRIFWSVPLLLLLILVRRQLGAFLALRADQVAWLALSGLLVAVNWGVFVWALLNGRMLETSLGYYINPLVSVLLGVLFLGEWLRPAQLVAVALAAIGVVNEIVSVGVIPWAGLTLAVSFGFYGLVRKRLGVDSAVGLGVEAMLLLPLALGFLAYQLNAGQGALDRGARNEIAWLAASGLVTTFPLVCFAVAALKLPLTTLGFVQYLAPTITFFLAILVYGEAFRWEQSVTFGCIWAAVVIFSIESLYYQRRLQRRFGRAT
ncbi:MAG: EamA family transporter RarD [Pseudomonadales bacterium]|nr:EamA family transporter RarD [Pseudomonadales bacterium]NIX09048.1 EamA family transporter RarD [Pseudomonadales bacterium]